MHVHIYYTHSINKRGCPSSWEAYKVGSETFLYSSFLRCGTYREAMAVFGTCFQNLLLVTDSYKVSYLAGSLAAAVRPLTALFSSPHHCYSGCRCHTTSSTLRGQPPSTLTSSAEEENSPRACSLVCSTSSRCVHAWLNTCTCIHVHPSPPPSHSPFPSPLRLLSLILLFFLVALLNVDYITNANQLAFPHVV